MNRLPALDCADVSNQFSRRTFNCFAAAGLLGFIATPAEARANAWATQTLKSLSLDAKIGQLMMPMLEDLEEARLLVNRFGVGGFVCFRATALEMANQTNLLQSLSRVPLLMSADFERGAGAYIDGATDLPIAMAIGATGDAELAYQAGALTAREARALGVQVVFAPVLDVNNNPKNPIINVRSFGESPESVGRLGSALVSGLEQHGALATVKHFPGHGNVGTDTHRDLGILAGTRDALERIELVPFRHVLAKVPHGLMASHLWVQALDRKPVPASLSPRVIAQFLRRDMGYGGLVYTDSLGMGAITNFVSGDWAQAQVLAIQAGCDVLVMPSGLDAARQKSHLAGVETGVKAIRKAVQSGAISQARLDASVLRVLLAKAQLGLDRKATIALDGLQILGSTAHQKIAERIARKAITLVQDRGPLLPLRSERLGIITLTNREGAGAFGRASDEFVPALPPTQVFEAVRWSLLPTPAELEAARELARTSDVLVIAAYLKVFVGDESTDLTAAHRAAIRELQTINPKIVFISFGSPYALTAVRDLPTLICAYDDSKSSQVVTARALSSREPWTGKLPVEIDQM